MTIQDMVRRDYLDAVKVAETMAGRCPAGSPERDRWLHVAAVYAQVTEEGVAEQGQAGEARPVKLRLGSQPS